MNQISVIELKKLSNITIIIYKFVLIKNLHPNEEDCPCF